MKLEKKGKGERRILLNALGKQYFLKVFKILIILKVPYNYLSPESNRERIAFGPLLITVLFLALKKTGFSKKKILPPPKKKFFLPFFYATFQCGRYNVFKKIFFFF